MPIVAVYFAAHYLLYLVTYGQLTWKVIIDPLERDWVPDLGIWTGYPVGRRVVVPGDDHRARARVRDLRRAPDRTAGRAARAGGRPGCRRR